MFLRKLRLPVSFTFLIALAALAIAMASCGLELTRRDQVTDISPTSDNVVAVPESVPQEFRTFFEAWDVLKRRHVDRDSLDPYTLNQGAIRGMLEALDDPTAAYLNSNQRSVESEDIRGSFSGIGAEVIMRDGRITIVSPIFDTPAERAGLRAEDVILEINGESTKGLSLLDAVSKIRGPQGEPVDIVILRQSSGESISLTIVRDFVKLASAKLRMLVGGIAHLKISSFTEFTNQQVVEALEKVGKFDARGMVLDLRNNPGGLLQTVVDVTSNFLDDGLVLYEVDGNDNRRNWPVKSTGLARDIPLVVLVNGGSASGSEVLAGALMDHNRATVMGTKTFGKGRVNILRELSDGAGIYFTVALWYTPDGTQIDKEGLEPDIEVKNPEDGAEDLQLDRAIELLEAQVKALE